MKITHWDLFRLFCRLGTTSFGGLAMIEPMRRAVVEDKAWLSQQDFLDGVALCQLLPGATVVQLATYVGCRLRGTRGALAAALAFTLPAFCFMLGLSALYQHYADLAWVKAVSRGLGAMVIALLLQALWRLSPTVRQHWLDLSIAGLALVALWLRANYLAVFVGAGALRLVAALKLAPASFRMNPVFPAPEPGGKVMQTEVREFLLTIMGIFLLLLALFLADRFLLEIAGLFLQIGMVSFGGGYVMIPALQFEVVNHLQWLTQRQFLDGILFSYITPGPLIIMAAFVGYLVKGVAGAIVATVSIFAVPILAIMVSTPIFQRGKESPWLRPIVQGILAALVGMLALVIVQMGLAALTDWRTLGLMLAAAAALIGFEVNLIWVALATGGLSYLIF